MADGSSQTAVRVLCAPDKFGGAASASAVAAAMAEGVRDAGGTPDVKPIADGGEGTFDVLRPTLSQVVHHDITGPLGVARQGRLGRLSDGCRFIECADACGLWLVDTLRPLHASTRGVGELVMAALEDPGVVAIGLGGSATVDLGAGLAWSLGVRFFDDRGRELGGVNGHLASPAGLREVDRIEIPEGLPALRGRATCWSDTLAPLLGPAVDGRAFLSQKGVTPAEVDTVRRFWDSMLRALQAAGLSPDPAAPGAGAAGGLGLMLQTLLGAPTLAGADAVLDAVGFDDALFDCDLVLTGEGRFDAASSTGKAPGAVVARASRHGVRSVVLAGAVADGLASPDVIAISDPSLPLQVQLQQTLSRVRDAARQVVARQLDSV